MGYSAESELARYVALIEEATEGRNREIVRMREQGATFDEIATTAGLSQKGVRNIIQAHLTGTPTGLARVRKS